MKAKKLWIEVAAILVSAAFISIFIYLIFLPLGYLEVVKVETDPLKDPSDIFSTYRTTTVILKWHGRNGTLLNFDYLGRDYVMGGDRSRTVNDGDEFTVYIPVGWAWVEIRYGGKTVNIDCYGKVVGD